MHKHAVVSVNLEYLTKLYSNLGLKITSHFMSELGRMAVPMFFQSHKQILGNWGLHT